MTIASRFTALLLVCLGLNVVSLFAQHSKPNIIVILTDDAGYADFGFQSNKLIPTPNINLLQQNGVTFSQAYVTAPNCSPSRAGLLTGKYQQRFGHEYNLHNARPVPGISRDSLGLPLSQQLIPQYLKKLGYTTGAIGKWHLGTEKYYHPMQRGFDSFFGTLQGSSYYLTGQAKEIINGYHKVNPESLSYLTDVFGDKAVQFIQQQNGPFFLYLAFNAPHVPLQAKKEYLDLYKKKFNTPERATNAAMTRSIDDNVGKVINVLKQKGIWEQTLIVFSNDNGGPIDNNGGNGSNNAPLRGAKVMLYEGGIRVPMIIHWPAVIKGKRKSGQVVSSLDWLPTFLAIAGEKNNTKNLDGINILELLKKEQAPVPRDMYWRQGKVGAVRSGSWKLVYFDKNVRQPELYNLKKDPGETTNLFLKQPAIANQLLEKYTQWQQQLSPPLWTGGPPNEQVLKMYDKIFVPKN